MSGTGPRLQPNADEDAVAEQSDSTWNESRFRQRLVGAAVVVALAVLLLPLWLDGSGIDSLSVQPIPEKPEIARTDPGEIPEPSGDSIEPLDDPPAALFPDQASAEARAGNDEAEAETEAPVEQADPAGETTGEDVPSEETGAEEAGSTEPAEEKSQEKSQEKSEESRDETAGDDRDESAGGDSDESESAREEGEGAGDEETGDADASLPETSRQGDFVVQLGSFSDESNARALAESVGASGFKVSVEPLFSERGTVWRVRVGPYATRELATEATERLRQRIGRDGLVMTK